MFAGYTADQLGMDGALLVAASGLVVVFMMLGILAIIIMVISKVVNAISGKPAAVPAKKSPAPAPAASPAAAPAAPVQPAQDQDELVAVLMAAIAAESDSSPDSFRITNIQAR